MEDEAFFQLEAFCGAVALFREENQAFDADPALYLEVTRPVELEIDNDYFERLMTTHFALRRDDAQAIRDALTEFLGESL